MTAGGRCALHFAGHRISGAGLSTRFPAAQEARVAAEISRVLDELEVAAAFGSLAAGADLLVAEAVVARDIPLHLVFPFGIPAFRASSVAPSGGDWVARFDRIVRRAAHVEILCGRPDDDAAYARCTRRAMDSTQQFAAARNVAAVQLAVWDGVSTGGAAGTAADVAAWRSRGLPTRVIAPG